MKNVIYNVYKSFLSALARLHTKTRNFESYNKVVILWKNHVYS